MAKKFSKDDIPDWFCPIPFATLIFNPWGNVGSCREQGNHHSVGDIRTQSWEEIWNGPRIRAWRREFLTGNIKTCAEHIRHRQCHKATMVQALLPLIELSEIQSTPPKRISPDFNGHCNLECEMCSIWREPNGLYDKIGFWEKAEKNLFPFLHQIDPLAGEPFMQKDTYRLMDIMARVNPTCAWRITTNGHWKLTDYIRGKLDQINLKVINISVDSVNENTYAKIRKKGDLKVVLKNIDDILSYNEERKRSGRQFHVMINTVVQRHNWKEVKEFVRFALERKTTPFVQFLYVPRKLSLLSLSERGRARILRHYCETLEADHWAYCGRLMIPLIESLPEPQRALFWSTIATRVGAGQAGPA